MYSNYDPIHAYDVYSADEYMAQQKWQLIRDEMYNMKCDAMERIDAVIHPEYAKDFIALLCVNVTEEDQNAENIARRLGLTQQHIYALKNDEKNYASTTVRSAFSYEPDYDRYADYV